MTSQVLVRDQGDGLCAGGVEGGLKGAVLGWHC